MGGKTRQLLFIFKGFIPVVHVYLCSLRTITLAVRILFGLSRVETSSVYVGEGVWW